MCMFPISTKAPNYVGGFSDRRDVLLVPCRKCPQCLNTRVNQWVFKCKQEDKTSISSLFVTLTYSDENLIYTDKGYVTLYKKDFQNFMKRLRKYYPYTIKYFACGEYGTRYKRPHYHAILFNVYLSDVEKAWSLNGQSIGLVHAGFVSGNSVAYVAQYFFKGGNKVDKDTKLLKDGTLRFPEFQLFSRGIGASYLSKDMIAWHRSDIKRNFVVMEGGIKMPLPVWFRKRIWSKDELYEQGLYAQEASEFNKYQDMVIYEREQGSLYDYYEDRNKARRAAVEAFKERIKQERVMF